MKVLTVIRLTNVTATDTTPLPSAVKKFGNCNMLLSCHQLINNSNELGLFGLTEQNRLIAIFADGVITINYQYDLLAIILTKSVSSRVRLCH